MATRFWHGLAAVLVVCGCMKKIEKQTEATGSILGKKTQDVKEFDAKAERKAVKAKVEYTDPVSGPMSVLGYALEETDRLKIEHSLNIYNAMNGHFPKTHKEFMDKIIKENGITLNVLPAGKEWQYDVKEHKLVAVEKAKEKPEEKKVD